MDSGISPYFESAVVVVEMITIYMYLSGVFSRNDQSRLYYTLAYLLFGLVLGTASIFYPNMYLLAAITFTGVLSIAWFFHYGHILSLLTASLIYLGLVIGVDIMVATFNSLIFGIALELLHSFGVERILSTIVCKLFILLLVKIIVIVMEKHKGSLQRKMLDSIPLIICQLIIIAVISSIFISSYAEAGELTHGAFMGIIGLFLVDIVILWYYDLLVSIYELRNRNEVATLQLENQVKHYDTIKTHREAIGAFEHDMEKHIRVIDGLVKSGHSQEVSGYLESLTGNISENLKIVFTPHPTVSTILSECRRRADLAFVDMRLDISIPSDIGINQIDLTIILGNTIDNALEALEKMTSGQKKLHISLKQSDYYLFYEIKNTYNLSASKKRKKNESLHGYGLNNVRASVEKYDGNFDIKANSDEYTVTILLPCRLKSS